jgi:hypothetical protein
MIYGKIQNLLDRLFELLDKLREVSQNLVFLFFHKVLTYVEYRAVHVWRLPKYRPPPPSTERLCPPPAPKAGVHTRRAVRGVGGQYFGGRQPLDWPLTVSSLYEFFQQHGNP